MKKVIPFLLALLLLGLGAFSLYFFTDRFKSDDLDLSSEVHSISELATLECYYHNVARLEDPGQTFLITYGNKKVWFEYNGTVVIGIDFSKVVVEEPDSNGKVVVTLPPAKILDISVDKDSISEPLTETGLFASVTAEDYTNAYSEAQKNMKESAQADEALLAQGQEHAKAIIENFIRNLGDQIGETYFIEWRYVD